MQPWIIEEIWRREEEERERRDEKWQEQIRIDAPMADTPDEKSRDDETKRGVLIIQL